MSEHSWTQEILPVLDAGLPADDVARAERHLAECEECRRTLDEQRQLERSLTSLFAPVRPAAGLEDRMIQQLRAPRRPPSAFWPCAAAIAAVVVLGTLGWFCHEHLPLGTLRMADGLDERLPFFARDEKHGNELLHGSVHHGANLKHPPQVKLLVAKKNLDMGLIVKDGPELFEERAFDKGYEPKDGIVVPEQQLKTTLDQLKGRAFKMSRRAGDVIAMDHFFEAKDAGISGSLPDGYRAAGIRVNTETIAGVLNKTPANRDFDDVPNPEEPRLSLKTEKKDSSAPAAEPVAPGKASPAKRLAEANLGRADIFAVNAQAPAAPPVDPGRKIIRSGEVEFEVGSFDTAVAEINRLVTAIPGAYVVTASSEKLANGKMRGTLTLRTPPDRLDRLVTDLRTHLGKMGEMKNQRIGSQDVSKQYVDTQSRLRAARAMEERLLAIIKSAKGEIKDLIVAEKELGVWRTKIEEMEGEVRFLDNQVALSTLSIQLQEKDLAAAAGTQISERVRLGVEVEDVDKAHKSLLELVAKARGRVLRSELKQHAAGQREAIVHFEVAPGEASDTRQRLETLGTVANRDAERVQQAVGGSGPPVDGKVNTRDAQFQVSLYNLANVKPRETMTLKLACADVPAAYRKLQEAIAAASGLVHVGQLREENRLAVTAQLDFDLLSSQKSTIDKLLDEVGSVVSRTLQQVPPTESATRRKFGYRLELANAAGLPSREKLTMEVDVVNVESQFTSLADAVKADRGTISAAQLNKEKSGRITGVLRFEVPLAERERWIRTINDLGTVRVQELTRDAQVPDSPLATAQFQVTLSGANPIVPSDQGLVTQLRRGLYYAFVLLSWSVMFLLIGLAAVLPWALAIYLAYRIMRRPRNGQ